MMSMVERLQTFGDAKDRAYIRSLTPLVTFRAHGVAHLHWNTLKSLYGPPDFPNSTPSVNRCMVEWFDPPTAKFADRDSVYQLPERKQWGVIVTNCVDKYRYDFMVKHAGPAPADTVHVVTYEPFLALKGSVQAIPVKYVSFLNKDGLVLDSSVLIHPECDWKPAANPDDADDKERELSTMMHIVNKTFTFANCKGTTLKEVTAEVQSEPKKLRRLKLPETKYYTLVINNHVMGYQRSDADPTNVGMMPFHLTRGHFATYGPNKPLFGKYTGTFWVPPHTRGNKKNGEIVKDYRVEDSASLVNKDVSNAV